MWELGQVLVNEKYCDLCLVGKVVKVEQLKSTVSYTVKTLNTKVSQLHSSSQEGLEGAGWTLSNPLALDEFGQIREDV